MVDIIVAHNFQYGIGRQGKIPWHCPEDLKLFKKLTSDSILIMGRKTVESLPNLPDRIIFCLSKSKNLSSDNNDSKIFSDFHTMIQYAKEHYPNKKIFIAGGAQIYDLAFKTIFNQIVDIHISIIQNDTFCDTFFNHNLSQKFSLIEKQVLQTVVYHHYRKKNEQEKQYLSLLSEIFQDGTTRFGRNGETKSLFSKNMTFNLQEGFPLLTTKKMFFRGIVEELLFFIRGETNSKILEEKGVNIWKANTDRTFLDKINMEDRKEGIMGPLYGYQWRFFNAKYNQENGKPLEKGFDQLKLVIDTIKQDPSSRRILMTDFNPLQATDGVLYPCHSILLQFYVSDNYLDMYCYNRSQDLFLGTPFNIASSALLLTFIANVTKLLPRFLHMGLGDVHIYKPHYTRVLEQIYRHPYPFPHLKITKTLNNLSDLENLSSKDITIENYFSYPTIKAEMVA